VVSLRLAPKVGLTSSQAERLTTAHEIHLLWRVVRVLYRLAKYLIRLVRYRSVVWVGGLAALLHSLQGLRRQEFLV